MDSNIGGQSRLMPVIDLSQNTETSSKPETNTEKPEAGFTKKSAPKPAPQIIGLYTRSGAAERTAPNEEAQEAPNENLSALEAKNMVAELSNNLTEEQINELNQKTPTAQQDRQNLERNAAGENGIAQIAWNAALRSSGKETLAARAVVDFKGYEPSKEDDKKAKSDLGNQEWAFAANAEIAQFANIS